MKNNGDIIAACLLIVAGLTASLFHFPSGTAGAVAIVFAATAAPGYLLCRCACPGVFDRLEIYAVSFAAGASMFAVMGMFLFFMRAPVDAAVPCIAAVGAVLAFINFRKKFDGPIFEPIEAPGGLKWIVIGAVLLTVAASYFLGSFRGWGEDWDYYSYITMVRRLAVHGIAADYSLAYINSGPDPIHGRNVWALLWAAVSRGAKVDPIDLYVKSAFITVPAALTAFYSLTRALFGRFAAMVALLLYWAFHVFGMGLILLGRTTFYNADPAWLIFFPAALAMGWSYAKSGSRGVFATALLVTAGAFMVHPLWGSMLVPAFFLMIAVSLWPRKTSGRAVKLLAESSVVLFALPLIFSLLLLFSGGRLKAAPLTIGTAVIVFFIAPLLLAAPWLAGGFAEKWKEIILRRSAYLLLLAVIVLLPFLFLRLSAISHSGSAPSVTMSPYKVFLAGSLFVLSPWNYTYTAPDMTLFPYILLGIVSIPFLIYRHYRGEKAAGFAAAGILLIPVIANHSYLSMLFVKSMHIAYLRRALRFGAMFAACGAGAFIAAALSRRPKHSGIIALASAIAVGCISAAYPYSPPYFQNAFSKSMFIATRAPSNRLFWSADYNSYKNPAAVWDTEEFSSLVEKVPRGGVIFSDHFTSYRLTAYRDVFVVCRDKPSEGVKDQLERERDQALFFDRATPNIERCRILKKYGAGWVLLNVDPDYRIRDYYLGDPWTAEDLLRDKERFHFAGRIGNWVLFSVGEGCV